MTQGEFKKRISDTSMTGYYERDVYYVSMEEVHKLVDEAKKDLLEEPTELNAPTIWISKDKFEKWFGRQPKK